MLQAGQPQLFRVGIDDLSAGTRRFETRLDSAWLDWAFDGCEYPVCSSEGSVALELEAVSGGVLVRGLAKVEVETDCGICLAPTRLAIEAEIGCFMMPRTKGNEDDEDREWTPEDLEREWFSGDVLLLDEIIRDAIMLELPMTPRCAPDCAVPGANPEEDLAAGMRPIDPRLAPLAGFLKNMKESD